MPWGPGCCVLEDPAQREANAALSPGTSGHGGAHGTNRWVGPTRGIICVFMIQRDVLKSNPDNSDRRRADQDAVAAALNLKSTTMQKNVLPKTLLAIFAVFALSSPAFAQIGRRFPSEKKIVPDPVTGIPLTFLTSTLAGDSKIYQTHRQWTSDGQWLIFRSRRAPGQAMAVNEATGDIVQVTEKGYTGMLCVARLSMKLYLMRDLTAPPPESEARLLTPVTPRPEGMGPGGPPPAAQKKKEKAGGFVRPRGPFQIVEVDLAKIFADSAAGTMRPADSYERVCGTVPTEIYASGNMGLDANEDYIYFGVSGGDVGKNMDLNNPVFSQYVEPGTNHAKPFGPRGMGGGPTGLRSMNLKTGEVKTVVDVPFQIGHVQTNPWVPGEIVFCWETGGKAPQRTWTVMADGTGLRPLYAEEPFEWVTHEAVITKDEVVIAIPGTHRPTAGNNPVSEWGPAGSVEHPTGVGIVNLRTREMRIVGQVPVGDPGGTIWHVNGSADGRWAAADDSLQRLWLIDRHSGEMILLSDNGHHRTAADHQHPTFNASGTEIEIQSAMLSEDGRSLNICVVPVPKSWLARTYSDKIAQ